MGQRSDEDLFLAFTRHRDCTALGALFRRRADELLRIAVFLAPRPTDAEDLVQATFLSAIAHAETWHPGSRVMNWLCGILTNHARMLRRAERRTPPLPGAAASDNEPLLAALRSELRSTLAAAIATLPEPYRSVMTLHLHDGLDSHEISRRLLRPPATVRKQMERAIDRLRAALPLGLATALLVRVDPAQIAANAADAARFVDGAPLDAPTGDGAPPPPAPMPLSLSRRAGPLLFAAAGVIAIIVGVAETMAAAHTRVPVDTARPDARLPADGPNVLPTVASRVGTTTGPQAELLRVAAGPAAPLQVTVVDADGRPAPALALTAAVRDGRPLPERLLADSCASATTDRGGIATWPSLADGTYEIAMRGALPLATVTMSGASQAIAVRLPAPMTFTVVVTDDRGGAVADAEVLVSETTGRGDLPAVAGVTDAAGCLHGAVALVRGRLFVRHRDFVPSGCERIENGHTFRFELARATRSIDVAATDTDGRALAGCYVALVPRSHGTDFLAPVHTVTDAQGRCRLPDPGPEEAAVVASRPDVAPGLATLAPGADHLELVLGSGGSLRGTAVAADGTPLAHRDVIASPCGARSNEPTGPLTARLASTAADGSFRFAHLPLGPTQVRIFSGGGDRTAPVPTRRVVAGADVEVTAAGCAVELRGGRARELPGRLTTRTGAPLAGWRLVAVPAGGTAMLRIGRARSTVSGDDGTFALDGVDGDEDYQIGAFPPDADPRTDSVRPRAVARARASTTPCAIAVDALRRPAASIACRVLSANGRPAGGANLELRRVDFQCPTTSRTAGDGSCTFAALTAGDYWLAVASGDSGTQMLEVHVGADDEAVELGAIELPPPALPQVQVHGANAIACEGLRVVVRHRIGDKFVEAVTDANGRATVPPLPPGLVHVLLHGPGILPIARDVELASGACWLDFAAEPAESVAARFDYQQADNPFTVNGPLRVQVFDRGGALVLEDYVRAATAPGRFDFATGLPAGDYRVRATALWNGIADCDLPVRRGATAPVVATLRL